MTNPLDQLNADVKAGQQPTSTDYPSGASPTGFGTDLSLDTDQKLGLPVWITRNGSTQSFNGKPVGDTTISGSRSRGITQGRMTTAVDAYDEFHRMSAAEQRAFARKLEQVGALKPGEYTESDVSSLWNQAVDEVANIYRATDGAKRLSPTAYVSGMASISGRAPAGNNNARQSQTTSSVNLSTRADARAGLTDALRAALGRDPDKKEITRFHGALNRIQRNTPSVSTDTGRTTGPEGNRKTRTSTQTSGGVNPTAVTQNYVDTEFDDEQDSRMAATGYYDALLGLAGGGG